VERYKVSRDAPPNIEEASRAVLTPATPTPALDSGEEPRADERPARPWYRQRLAVVAMAVGGVLASGLGGRAYLHARGHESTDDAFIEGHVVQMSPRVAGHVAKLLVTDNQHVEAGQVLIEIDPRDFQARVGQARGARRGEGEGVGREGAARPGHGHERRGRELGEGGRGAGRVRR
jgi:membrane fusion protein (multidrug efflux system)